MTELQINCRKKKKSKKRESSSDESDAEEQVIWMEKKSKPALLVVNVRVYFKQCIKHFNDTN